MEKIAIIGTSGRIPLAYARDTEGLLAHAGLNTGNLAFPYAVAEHVRNPRVHVGFDITEAQLDGVSLLVFCAANHVNAAWDLGALADTLEKTNLPLVVLGLGAQAPELGARIDLKPGTKRLLALFADRARVVGVRGDYTASVLEPFRIKNLDVLGCPSSFISPDPALGARIASSRPSVPRRIVLSLNLGNAGSLVAQSLITTARWAGGDGTISYVWQDPASLIGLTRGDVVPQSVARSLGERFLPGRSLDEFERFADRHFHAFFDVEAWLEFLRGHDFSFGTRIHGNILATQVGVLSLVLDHDSRTAELAETLGLPHLSITQLAPDATLESVYRSVDFDGDAFDTRRRALATRYLTALEGAGLTIAPRYNCLRTSPETAPAGC
jgi:hypothetical protein